MALRVGRTKEGGVCQREEGRREIEREDERAGKMERAERREGHTIDVQRQRHYKDGEEIEGGHSFFTESNTIE